MGDAVGDASTGGFGRGRSGRDVKAVGVGWGTARGVGGAIAADDDGSRIGGRRLTTRVSVMTQGDGDDAREVW